MLEAYPNCPKYIQRREMSLSPTRAKAEGGTPSSGAKLTPKLRDVIAHSDTLFVASAHPERGVDVSHRGGNPGFVEIVDEQILRVPDYVGNGMFNTLGNFVSHPQAGLLFIDFVGGTTLQLIGTPTILWELDRPDDRSGGTRRYWDFTVERWVERDLPLWIDWEFVDYSRFNPPQLATR